jgi:hypothetical protein
LPKKPIKNKKRLVTMLKRSVIDKKNKIVLPKKKNKELKKSNVITLKWSD